MMKEVMALHGHLNWVKNAEPVSDTLLITAGFDGTVRLWDINQPYGRPEVSLGGLL